MNIISAIRHMIRIRRQRIFYLDAPNDIITVSNKADIKISKVTSDNVERVVDFRAIEHAGTSRKYLTEGQYGIYAWLGAKVVGHAWAKLCTKPHFMVNRYFDLKQGEAFIHYCNVDEDHRGQDVFPLMLACLCHRLFDEAKAKRIIIDTEVDNEPSLRGIAKVGFKPLGSGIYVQFLGRRIFKRVTYYRETLSGNIDKENVKNGEF
jgi:hypothetical protein